MHLACRAGRVEAVRRLLDGGAMGGADPQLPCKRGHSPLHYVRANRGSECSAEIVKMLNLAEQEELSNHSLASADRDKQFSSLQDTTSDGIRKRKGMHR